MNETLNQESRGEDRLGLTERSQVLEKSNRRLPASRLLKTTIIAAITLITASDMLKFFSQNAGDIPQSDDTMRGNMAAWASWIGEIPSSAEVYSDASTDMPAVEAFDDEDDDEELDASASNEYPENENDEAYEDAEDADNAESRRLERWIAAFPSSQVPEKEAWVPTSSWRRRKRDIEDRIALANRRAVRRGSGDDDFNVDDSDVDAWVNDGVDDIYVSPETKRAASEMSYDEKSIDAEYEPQQVVPNRTRVTTISEIIPMDNSAINDE